jgi:IclR family transcriptional regulator, acetate operon repressor
MSQSASKTFDLLEQVARSRQPRGLIELAEECGIDKTTASRVLGFLVDRGYLSRDPVSRQYSLGLALLALSAPTVRRFSIDQGAGPILEHLRDRSGETATLHVRIGSDRVCTGGVESTHALRRVVPLGERLPLAVGGASGRAIAAFLSPTAMTPGEEASTASSRRWRREVLANGYYAGVDDRTDGVAGISAPIFNREGVYGSITVAGPKQRWTLNRMVAFAPEMLEAARQITERLGGTSPDRLGAASPPTGRPAPGTAIAAGGAR